MVFMASMPPLPGRESGARRQVWFASSSTALGVLGLVIGLTAPARARAGVPGVQWPVAEVSRAIKAASWPTAPGVPELYFLPKPEWLRLVLS